MKQKTTRHFTKFGVELKWDGERTTIDERPVEKYVMDNIKKFDANRRLFAYTEKYVYIFDVTPGFKSVTFLLEDGWEGVVTLQKHRKRLFIQESSSYCRLENVKTEFRL